MKKLRKTMTFLQTGNLRAQLVFGLIEDTCSGEKTFIG